MELTPSGELTVISSGMSPWPKVLANKAFTCDDWAPGSVRPPAESRPATGIESRRSGDDDQRERDHPSRSAHRKPRDTG